jgi:hypothetical protein
LLKDRQDIKSFRDTMLAPLLEKVGGDRGI